MTQAGAFTGASGLDQSWGGEPWVRWIGSPSSLKASPSFSP